ncbi:MAG: hypothetical protein ACRCWR_11180 [Saezia sp.]
MSDQAKLSETMNTKPKKGFLLKAVGIVFCLFLLLVGGLWVWSGSQGSFATGLSFVQNRLPVKSLTVSDAQASLRSGGHLGSIRIEQNDGSIITLLDVQIDWNLLGLLKKELVIEQLSAQKVHIINAPVSETADHAQPESAPSDEHAPSQPPQQVVLPFNVDLKQLQIAHVVQGEKEQEIASHIDLSFRFDGTQHTLVLRSAHLADGVYEGNITLTANQPQLDATLKGVLTTKVPQSNQNVTINVDAKIAGPIALLSVKANALAATGSVANSSKAILLASVAPWAGVKIPQADLELQAFNAKAYWAQAPETLLSGTVKVSSSADSVTAKEKALVALNIKNAIPGGIDLSKMPISGVTGTVTAQGSLLTFNKLDIKVGNGTAIVTGNAQLPQKSSSSPLTWHTDIKLTNVDPHSIYSQVASDRLSGTVVASQKSATAIAFDASISAGNGASIPQFRVKQLVTNGTFFMNDRVVLNSLTVNSPDAQVKGQNVSYSLKNGAMSGPLKLIAPGLEADATLNALAQYSGGAKVSLNVSAADKASQWLRKQPINLGSLLDFLDKSALYTQNLVNYTKEIPIVIDGGWAKPHVTLGIDLNALIVKIIENEGKNKLLERLGVPQTPQGNETPRQQAEQQILNHLGGLLNRQKP